MILDDEGYHTKCDWCGVEEDFRDIASHQSRFCSCKRCAESLEAYDITHEIWPVFFGYKGATKLPPEFPKDLCKKCVIELTPWVERFADLWAVQTAVNHLQRSIYDRRKENRGTQDDGAASHNAGERG